MTFSLAIESPLTPSTPQNSFSSSKQPLNAFLVYESNPLDLRRTVSGSNLNSKILQPLTDCNKSRRFSLCDLDTKDPTIPISPIDTQKGDYFSNHHRRYSVALRFESPKTSEQFS